MELSPSGAKNIGQFPNGIFPLPRLQASEREENTFAALPAKPSFVIRLFTSPRGERGLGSNGEWEIIAFDDHPRVKGGAELLLNGGTGTPEASSKAGARSSPLMSSTALEWGLTRPGHRTSSGTLIRIHIVCLCRGTGRRRNPP